MKKRIMILAALTQSFRDARTNTQWLFERSERAWEIRHCTA